MTFGQKLKTLRKEKGYSQEEFAELLEVSRQAVSKWESDRGTPETDKLLRISTLFGVSLDYLLKEDAPEESGCGYYVSRETIDGYLSYRRQRAGRIALGVGLLIAADVFGCFPEFWRLLLPFYWGCEAAGVSVLVWVLFQPRQYARLSGKALLFDPGVWAEFQNECGRNRRRYAGMIVLGVLLLSFATEFLSLAVGVLGSPVRNALDWMADAAGVMLLIVAGLSLHAETTLLKSRSAGDLPGV